MTEHAVNNGSSICQTAAATHLILTYREFCTNKTVGFSYSGQRAELEFHLVFDPVPPEIQLSLYVRNISKQQWHILTYADPFNNNTDTEVKELAPNEDVFLYAIREFSFGNRDELIIYFRFDRDAVMLQAPEVEQEQLKYMWSRLQSLLEDSQFADMRVNGLPAHRAVLAAASGPLHDTISALIPNNRSSDVSTTHETTISKTFKHSNVDTENINKNPIEVRPENDVDPKDYHKEGNESVKINNDGLSEYNNNQREKIADKDKLAEDTNKSIEERNIQHSADSQENDEIKKEYTSCVKRDGNIVNKTSEDVNNEAIKVIVNNAETFANKKDKEDKKITLSQLSKLFENQLHEEFSVEELCSRVNNFLNEQEDDAIEIMERPNPDNYTLDILGDKKSTEMFLEYIYTKCWNHRVSKTNLILVARKFELECLETYMEMLICSSIAPIMTRKKFESIIAAAESLSLYTLKLKAVRWVRQHHVNCFPKYLLTMPPNHRYQHQYTFSINVPNISNLKGGIINLDCKVFYIRGNAVQVKVELSEGCSIRIYLLKTKEVDMALNISINILKKDEVGALLDKSTDIWNLVDKTVTPDHRSLLHQIGVWFFFDLANADVIVDDCVEFLVSVEADDLWLTENI